MNNTKHVLIDVEEERKRQSKKWGIQTHSPSMWMAILMEEVGEASREIVDYECENPRDESLEEIHDLIRKELVQVAAVAVQIIERIDAGDFI